MPINSRELHEGARIRIAKRLSESMGKPSDEVISNAYGTAINSLISKSFDAIGEANGILANLDTEKSMDGKDELHDIVTSYIDTLTTQVGLLTKALDAINPKTTELIDMGKEMAYGIVPVDERLEEDIKDFVKSKDDIKRFSKRNDLDGEYFSAVVLNCLMRLREDGTEEQIKLLSDINGEGLSRVIMDACDRIMDDKGALDGINHCVELALDGIKGIDYLFNGREDKGIDFLEV